ncbi:MAG: hypothetical protein R2815_11995 [Flavobacteriales bacterium]|nr:hypothetical protein [Flavobacteriales bacterium]
MRSRAVPGGHDQQAVVDRVKDQYWPGTLMGFGIFIALGSLFTVAPWTLIDPGVLFRVFLVLCFAGNLLPYLRSGLWLGMERLEWFLFNLLAIGPIGTSGLLWINFLFHGPSVTTVHPVSEVIEERTIVTYVFGDDYLSGFPFARGMFRDMLTTTHAAQVRVTVAEGALGYGVVLRKEPLTSVR